MDIGHGFLGKRLTDPSQAGKIDRLVVDMMTGRSEALSRFDWRVGGGGGLVVDACLEWGLVGSGCFDVDRCRVCGYLNDWIGGDKGTWL